jgi:SH3-like domain-containing protein
MNIIIPSVQMKSNPSETSSLETECLFGEQIEILDEHFDWVYCRLKTDNYKGWIKKNTLGRLKSPTHRVKIKNSFVYLENDAKSQTLYYVPMGAQLTINNIKSNWAEVIIWKNENMNIGYIPSNHIVNINHKVKDWVKVAEGLENTPYQWGGRDTRGIDCSALLQLSYQHYGQNIPRNTSQQVKLNKNEISSINALKRGCVVFWEGHVAIMVSSLNCVHANAFHMKAITEPLVNIINRMGKNHRIVKMMDFN